MARHHEFIKTPGLCTSASVLRGVVVGSGGATVPAARRSLQARMVISTRFDVGVVDDGEAP
jgi:hypothetical protein